MFVFIYIDNKFQRSHIFEKIRKSGGGGRRVQTMKSAGEKSYSFSKNQNSFKFKIVKFINWIKKLANFYGRYVPKI